MVLHHRQTALNDASQANFGMQRPDYNDEHDPVTLGDRELEHSCNDHYMPLLSSFGMATSTSKALSQPFLRGVKPT